MSDTRLAMREFRFLDEKRKLTALSSNEEQRWRELKQVLGVAEARPPPSPPPPPRDVDPGQSYHSEANGYPALGSSEPTGLDFNPDQMYGGASAEPIATPNIGLTAPNYSPHATPGYGQSPLADPDRHPIEQAPADDPTLPAAELLGLTEPVAVEAPTPADIPSEDAAEAPLEISGVAAPTAEDLVELDPSEVTLLEAEINEVQAATPAEVNEVQAATPVPEAPPPEREPIEPAVAQTELAPEVSSVGPESLPEAPTEIAPPVVAVPDAPIERPEVSEEITIDLSAAEAIDTGEFAPAQPSLAEEPPVIQMAPEDVDTFDRSGTAMAADGRIAAPVFTQAPVALEEQQSTVPTSLVPGEHRVIVHTHEGQVKRGMIRDPDLWGQSIVLEHSGQAETLPTHRLKAIFFMVPGGAGQTAPSGQKVRVTLADGRQVVGFSSDFRSEAPGFFLVPADVRTNTSRVYLFRSAVDLISEE